MFPPPKKQGPPQGGPPPQQPPFPAGPGGMPLGGSMPGDMGDDGGMDLSGSPLLQGLMGSMGGGGMDGGCDPMMGGCDPSMMGGGGMDPGAGGDPNMGLQQLLQLLALAQGGVGGGPDMGMGGPPPRMGVPPGGSGMPYGGGTGSGLLGM